MRIEQEGSSTQPVCVDDAFFGCLKPILQETHSQILEAVAKSNGVSLQLVQDIERRGEPDTSLDRVDYKRDYRIWHELSRSITTTFNLSYNNGYSFKTSSLEELLGALNREPGRPTALTINSGSSLTSVDLYIRLMDGFSVAYFRISGERRNVDHLSRRVTDLFRSSAPEHAWVHTPWPGRAIQGIGVIAFGTAFVFGLARAEVLLGRDAATSLAGWFFIVTAVGFWFASYPARILREAYPPLQFNYGPEQKRRSGTRSLILAALTLVAVPALVSLAISYV
ncbi:hypothetical protein [Allosphingosinicella humi]